MGDRRGGNVRLVMGLVAVAAAALAAVAVGMRLGEDDRREAQVEAEAPLVR